MKRTTRTAILLSMLMPMLFYTAFVKADGVLEQPLSLTLYDESGASYDMTFLIRDHDEMVFDVVRTCHCGHEQMGMAFYNRTWANMKFVMYEDDHFYGYTYEGYWTGDGSQFYAILGDGQTFSSMFFWDPPAEPEANGWYDPSMK